jgi:ribosome maturation factor RimP
MQKAPQQLVDLVRGVTDVLGYELVGVELLSRDAGGHLLRVYIDTPAGVNLSDCENVSHQLSGVLDVEAPLRGEYALEVSSPGLDRPLFELAHFERFTGREARVRLRTALDGRRNFKGSIVRVGEDAVHMLVDGETVELPASAIDAARLVPEF